MADLPNLELLLYKAQMLLTSDKEFARRRTEKPCPLDFNVIVFPQIWGSTCTGFDILPDGRPVVSESAMTKEYTTIIHETTTDCYCVFFGERPCYKVTDANKNFYKDLDKRNMASLSEAKKRY